MMSSRLTLGSRREKPSKIESSCLLKPFSRAPLSSCPLASAITSSWSIVSATSLCRDSVSEERDLDAALVNSCSRKGISSVYRRELMILFSKNVGQQPKERTNYFCILRGETKKQQQKYPKSIHNGSSVLKKYRI